MHILHLLYLFLFIFIYCVRQKSSKSTASVAPTSKTKEKPSTRVQKKLSTRNVTKLNSVSFPSPRRNTFGGENITPQRDLCGKPIAVVHTPQMVYRALGMHLEAPKDVQRTWRKPAKGPIYTMAKRTRERWIRTGAPIFETVSKSLFGEHWYASHLHHIMMFR